MAVRQVPQEFYMLQCLKGPQETRPCVLNNLTTADFLIENIKVKIMQSSADKSPVLWELNGQIINLQNWQYQAGSLPTFKVFCGQWLQMAVPF